MEKTQQHQDPHSAPGQCPHMTFAMALMGSPKQRWVRKPTSSQLLPHLLPKTWACQSSRHTTGGLPRVAHIKNLESNYCHACGSHYSKPWPKGAAGGSNDTWRQR